MVNYAQNNPILCRIFPSGLKGVASDWFTLFCHGRSTTSRISPSCSSRNTLPVKSSSRTTTTSSSSRWDPPKVSRRMLATSKVNYRKQITAWKMSPLSHSSENYESLTHCTKIWWSTSPIGVRSYTGPNHTFSWRKRWKAPPTSLSSTAVKEKNWSALRRLLHWQPRSRMRCFQEIEIPELPIESTLSLLSG